MLNNYGPELARAAELMLRDVLDTKPGECVIITADTASDMRTVEAVQNAARGLEAKVMVTVIPQLPFQGALGDPYIPDPLKAAVENSDLWIDLTFPYMAGSAPFDEAMKNKRTRYYLAAGLGAESMIRMFGKVDLEKLFALTNTFDALLGRNSGQECRITNQRGTDVRFKLAEPIAMGTCKSEGPGPLFLPGTVMVMPRENSVQGVIIFDAVFHEYYTPLLDPICLKVDGKVQEVSGGLSEGTVLERSLKRASHDSLGYIIHFTCGFHPAARYTGTSFLEDQRVTGYNAVGLGLPFWMPGGGENHPDAILSRQSLWVAGEQIVDQGRIIGPPEMAALAKEMVPTIH
jgi:2,5-dihydroxypyridine 5,6-dioxygenase